MVSWIYCHSTFPINVIELIFSPNGDKIASLSIDGTIHICDCKTGNILLTFQVDLPTAFTFSQDGKMFIYIKGNILKILDITKLDDPQFINQQIKKFEKYIQNMKI